MATSRTRGRTPETENPAGSPLRWAWAAALSLIFVAAGLALVGGGLLFAAVGVRALLAPDDAGHAIAGVLFVVLGLAAVVGGVVMVWRLPRAVEKLSGRTPPRVLRWLAVAALSLVYYGATAGLVGFGAAFVWNGLGPGRAPEFAHPVAGVVMLVSGVAVFVFFPRLVKRLTGREVLAGPYGAYGAGGDFGSGGDGGGGGGGDGGGGGC